ncbi:hypothetical protein C1O66_21665 [Paucibacter aquatile]|uniref:Photosynthesis system II assembly factor Ycf48/Hcf136-like domain-containing protein n=1 Tax=Kinneretia aquatilis TaxID=2070761 RepID=A0A2N8KS94_9BURK|nr:YCF48-related protein [Paucibacter aquatile]PND36313.1 hypothetical protein C1O66_21665 [Paucibacter aquatile]
MASASASRESQETGADGAAEARLRWRAALFFLSMLALLLIPAAYFFQARFEPCGNPLEPGPAAWSRDWWACPIERNRAERRHGMDLLAELRAVHTHADGQRGWAVGSRGALLRTEDGGRSWDLVDLPAELKSSILNALVFAADGLRGWAAVEDGEILATLDGGKNWKLQRREAGKSWVQLLSTADGLKVWALSRQGEVYASEDGGQSWVSQAEELSRRILGLALQAGGQRLWAVDGNGQAWERPSLGEPWRMRSSSERQAFQTQDPLGIPSRVQLSALGTRAWALSRSGLLQFTEDGGASWASPAQLPGLEILAVHAQEDGLSVWAVGRRGRIALSRDGGRTWALQASASSADLYAVSFAPDGLRGWAVGEQGTVLRTVDGGQHWRLQQSSQRPIWGQVALMPDGRQAFVAGQPGAIQRTVDGGRVWQVQATGTREDLYRGAFLSDGLRGWVVGSRGAILATRDGGQSWQPQARGQIDRELVGVYFLPDGLRGWVVGQKGLIRATVDGGLTWLERSLDAGKPQEQTLFGIHASADGRRLCVVGERGGIWLSEDGGQRWRVASPATLPRDLMAVTGSPDGQRLWAVGEKGQMLRSQDGGQTWQTQQLAAADVDLYAVSFLADGQRGWVAGDKGSLHYTRDGGSSWQAAKTLPAGVERAALASVSFLEDGMTGLAAGEGGLVLSSRDGGQSWALASSGHAQWPVPGFLALLAGLLLLLLSLVGVMAWRFRGAPQSLRGLLNARAEADTPISRGDQDKLNFRPVVDALSYFLRHQATQAPLTVALTAPWGRGKSSMMRMLEDKLQRGGLHTVWFNVWHHQKEPVLLAALLNSLSAQAVPGWLTVSGWAFRSKLVWLRFARQPFLGLGPLLIWFFMTLFVPLYLLVGTLMYGFSGVALSQGSPAFASLADGLLALAALVTGNPASEALMAGEWSKFLRETVGALGSQPAKIVPLLLTLWGLLSVFFLFSHFARAFPARPGALLSSLGPRFSIAAAEEQTGFRQRFRDHFLDVAQALRPGTLTVFIDDLDRCEPAKAAEMLEAVNYLSDAGPCFIVLGMAMEVVEAQLGETYKDLAQRKHDFDLARQAPEGRQAHVSGQALDDRAAASEAPAAPPPKAAPSSQQVQLSYARKYLEKLVQIYVPVPSPSEEGLAQLLAEDGAAAPQRAAVARALALEQSLAQFNRRFWGVFRFAFVLLALLWLASEGQQWNAQREQARRDEELAKMQAWDQTLLQRQAAVTESRGYAHWLSLQPTQAPAMAPSPAASAASAFGALRRTPSVPPAPPPDEAFLRVQQARQALQQEQAWQRSQESQAWLDKLSQQRRDEAYQDMERSVQALDDSLAGLAEGLQAFRAAEQGPVRRLDPDAAERPGDRPAAPRASEAQMARLAEARPTPASPQLPTEVWAIYLPMMVFTALMFAGILLSRQRQQIRASEAYEDALADCRPLLQKLESLRAPREIKRFMNLSRYLALRVNARSYARLPSGLAWWPGLRQRMEALLPEPPEWQEQEVVALAALHLARAELAPQIDAVQWLLDPACRRGAPGCTAELERLGRHLAGGAETQARQAQDRVRRFLALLTEMQAPAAPADESTTPPA